MAILAFILVVILAAPLRDEITKATNTTNLNASDPNITVEEKATVIVLDLGIFYFIAIIIAASISYITGKKSVSGAITAIMVFIVVSVLITPLKSLIVLARDSTHLDCSNAAVTIGTKMACIVVDVWLFYFAVVAIAVAISYIFVKEIKPRITGEQ